MNCIGCARCLQSSLKQVVTLYEPHLNTCKRPSGVVPSRLWLMGSDATSESGQEHACRLLRQDGESNPCYRTRCAAEDFCLVPNPDLPPGVAPIRSIQDEKAKRGAHISQGGICCFTRSRSAALDDLQHIAGITSERAATLSDWR